MKEKKTAATETTALETAAVEKPISTEAGDADISTVDACVEHAEEIRDTQLALIKSKGYDFAPEFKEMTVQLYLLGVMWKFAENLGNNTNDARDLAFAALKMLLMRSGLQKQKIEKRIAFLQKMSKTDDDHNALAVAIGYESEPDDNSLAEVFDHYVDDAQVSGAFWRLYDRGRKIMLYGGLGIAFIVIWFVTLFLPGNSAISILAAGLISAALFVIPVFLVGLLIYRNRIKKAKQAG